MNHPKNVGEAFNLLLVKIALQYPDSQVARICNEINTGYYRILLTGLGWKRKDYTAKLTAEEKADADAFAANLPVKALLKLEEAQEKGFELAQTPSSSRATYGGRIRSCFALLESEHWYPGNAVYNRRLPDECRPRMRHGRGDWRAFSLMKNKGKNYKYRLEKHEISPKLQQQLDQIQHFMEDLNHFDRCFVALKQSTAIGYLKSLLLWLGWYVHEDNPGFNIEELTLEHLIPKISEDDLEHMSEKQRKRFYREQQRKLESLIDRHFDFLWVKQRAESPRVHVLKLAALLIAAKFLYASEVEDKEEYKDIPLIRTILKRLDQEQEDVNEWEKNQRYVADQSRKWPEPPEGQTVLEYTQEALIESLRLECRPRQNTGDFCKGHIIAKSHLIYLMFVDLGLLPPGRQQEPRSYQIALNCPIQRPETVPIDGVYWPLPPDWAREKGRNGTINDNYLYRTYHHDGQSYEQGIWVFETRDFKTSKCHGVRVDVIPNLTFSDGHRLYDYIDRYLCGQWYVGSFRNIGHRYSWWDTQLRGSYGKWLSKGREELCTDKTPVFVKTAKSEDWVSGYLFVTPSAGLPFTDRQMSEYFARNSFRIIGKRITPHTFRYMWATFSGQAGLSDAQLRSLATAMGCTPETLRRMYERMSPTERNRPINEAMQKLLPWHVEQDPPQEKGDRLTNLKAIIPKLTPQELQELRKLLEPEPAA